MRSPDVERGAPGRAPLGNHNLTQQSINTTSGESQAIAARFLARRHCLRAVVAAVIAAELGLRGAP